MIKVLAIGNSFSEDATALIELLTDKIYVRNLYIGGCYLEKHCNNIDTNSPSYSYQEKGAGYLGRGVSILEGLESQDWDYVTIQQVSGLSGLYDTYYPFITKLIDYIKAHSKAKIVLHQTWSYESNSTHGDFPLYNNDREFMWQKIKETTERVAKENGLGLIKSGELITNLRKHKIFDIKNGGTSLNRDGFHLSFNFGRLATASLWIKYFTGSLPDYYSRKNLSECSLVLKEELEKM